MSAEQPTPYYQDDAVTIYHGDCRDVLPGLSVRADLLLTDPPFGMAYNSNSGQAAVAADGTRQGMRVVRTALFESMPLLSDGAHVLMFCHWQSWPDFYDSVSSYLPIRAALIWHKGGGGMGNVHANYIRDYEVILYGAKGDRPIGGDGSFSSVLKFAKPAGLGRLHPTEKPIELLAHLIGRHSPAGGLVVDPFMGSGSTLEAAKKRGRRAVGIEIEERYCEVAASRCAQEILDVETAA